MVRTQLYLDEEIHRRLRRLADSQGKTLSELVREALERVYGKGALHERLRTLEAVQGLWRDRKDLGSTAGYVRRLRRDTRPSRLRKT